MEAMSMMSMSSAMASMSSAMSTMSMSMASASSSMEMSGMSGMSGMTMSMTGTMATATTTGVAQNNMVSGAHATMSGMTMGGMNMTESEMGGMDMDEMMMMNTALTKSYKDYPLLFQKLFADNNGQAFGLFVLIMVTCFVYKSLLFVSWSLEVHWFKKWNKNGKFNTIDSAVANGESNATSEIVPKLPNFLSDVFMPSLLDMFHDVIRTLLTFASTMLIYMLMLVAMSFVLTYVFAIITGLTLAEIFFSRWKVAMLKRWAVQRVIEKTKNCPGFGSCNCGRHKSNVTSANDFSSNDVVPQISQVTSDASSSINSMMKNTVAYQEKTESINEDIVENEESQCCCAPNTVKEEEQIERDVSDYVRSQENTGNMNIDLMPVERFS